MVFEQRPKLVVSHELHSGLPDRKKKDTALAENFRVRFCVSW